MPIIDTCSQILDQLRYLVKQISDREFCQPSETLSQSTIGQHLRHTLEFFICLESGYDQGVVNYDKRSHDKLIETDRTIALAVMDRITLFLNSFEESKPLRLEVSYDLEGDTFVTIPTNAGRELVYNIEHAVHHMAIMKIGVREVCPLIELPPGFGVAASTVRYKEMLANS